MKSQTYRLTWWPGWACTLWAAHIVRNWNSAWHSTSHPPPQLISASGNSQSRWHLHTWRAPEWGETRVRRAYDNIFSQFKANIFCWDTQIVTGCLLDLSIKKMSKCQLLKGDVSSAFLLRELLLLHTWAGGGTSVHTKDFLSLNIEISVYSSQKKAFWNGILGGKSIKIYCYNF